MADLGAFLSFTDHLSDRELYSTLWHETLREEHPIVPENYPLATHIDLLGGWSNEDIESHLKYYADEEERRECAASPHISRAMKPEGFPSEKVGEEPGEQLEGAI